MRGGIQASGGIGKRLCEQEMAKMATRCALMFMQLVGGKRSDFAGLRKCTFTVINFKTRDKN